MSPDASGNFRGIVVTKLWPGHRDYEPPCEECDGTGRANYRSERFFPPLPFGQPNPVHIIEMRCANCRGTGRVSPQQAEK